MPRRSPPEAALVAVVPNDLTAWSRAIEPLALERIEARPGSWAVHNHETPLTRRLRRRLGNERVIVPDGRDVPSLADPASLAHVRAPFLTRRIEEDRFLERLPLPGADLGRAHTIVWDRLQYGIYPVDWRPFVAALPWGEVGGLEVVGGISFASPIPMMLVAAARGRGLPVRGTVLGPVRGRFAPEWLPGCTEIVVGSRDQARILTDVLGCDATVEVDPRLAPEPGGATPLAGSGPPATLLLDVHATTPRVPARRALHRLIDRCASGIEALVIPSPAADRAHLGAVLGDEIAGVRVRHVAGSVHAHQRRTGWPVISFAPHRLVWSRTAVASPAGPVFVLEDEAAAAGGGEVPRELRPFVLETRAGVVA